MIGSYSIYEMPTRNKYVDESAWIYTPGELNREYLKYLMSEYAPKRKMIGYNKKTREWLKVPPPYYFGGYRSGELVHTDITSCYYNLYRRVTLDLKFGQSSLKPALGVIPFDHPEWLNLQSKAFKRGISGTITRQVSRKWIGGKSIKDVRDHNRFLAPELYGYMMMTLHCIAHELIAIFDAPYFAVDGVITDARHADAVRDYLSEKWQLDTHVKHGPGVGEVRGVGSYDIWPHRGGHRHRSRPYLKWARDYPYNPELAQSLKAFLRWLDNRGM
jgi:hypothetical protein